MVGAQQPSWAAQARWCSAKAEEKAAEETTAAAEDELEECPKELKIRELSKQVAYSLAEADNARKIATKDVELARQYALKSFAKDMLDVVDNLSRAVGSVKPEALEQEPSMKALHKGVTMTQHSLAKSLEKHGVVEQKVAIGDEFDPKYHDALFTSPNTESSTPGTVSNIVKAGFNYKERVLRASQVGVFQEEQ